MNRAALGVGLLLACFMTTSALAQHRGGHGRGGHGGHHHRGGSNISISIGGSNCGSGWSSGWSGRNSFHSGRTSFSFRYRDAYCPPPVVVAPIHYYRPCPPPVVVAPVCPPPVVYLPAPRTVIVEQPRTIYIERHSQVTHVQPAPAAPIVVAPQFDHRYNDARIETTRSDGSIRSTPRNSDVYESDIPRDLIQRQSASREVLLGSATKAGPAPQAVRQVAGRPATNSFSSSSSIYAQLNQTTRAQEGTMPKSPTVVASAAKAKSASSGK